MPDKGACLAVRFSVCNQLAVQGNEIPRGDAGPVDFEEFETDVDGIFGGQILKASYVRYRLLESEKQALLDQCVERYSTYDVSGTFGSVDNPSLSVGFNLVNLAATVKASDVEAFIIANCKLSNGNAPDRVFVGAFKKRV